MRKNKNIIWGVILVVIGIVCGFNAVGLTDISLFFDGWWTLFIIIPCIIGFINDSDKMGSIIGIILGILLLLGARDIIDYSLVWKLIFPIIIIVVGLSLIFKDNFDKEINKLNKNVKSNTYAIFAGQDISFNDEVTSGMTLTSVFGGIECDLRKANIKKDIVINTYNIFGGTDIFVPDNVRIKTKSTSIFGGVDNEKKDKDKENGYTIYINAICVFGGVEIK